MFPPMSVCAEPPFVPWAKMPLLKAYASSPCALSATLPATPTVALDPAPLAEAIMPGSMPSPKPMWICVETGSAFVPTPLLFMCRVTSLARVCALPPSVAVAARLVRPLSAPPPAKSMETCWMPISASAPAPLALDEAVAMVAPWLALSFTAMFCIHSRLLVCAAALDRAVRCESPVVLPCRSTTMPPSLIAATFAPLTW